MMDHVSTCPILNVNQKALDDELYCICGFSSNIGNWKAIFYNIFIYSIKQIFGFQEI